MGGEEGRTVREGGRERVREGVREWSKEGKREGKGGRRKGTEEEGRREGEIWCKEAYIEQCFVGSERDDMSEAVRSLASIGEVGIVHTRVCKSGGVDIHKWS